MRNDGVTAQCPPDAGNGLSGLSERMATAGGSFAIAREGGEFRLRAVVPA